MSEKTPRNTRKLPTNHLTIEYSDPVIALDMQTTRTDERLAVASTRVANTEVTLVAVAGRDQLVGLEPTPVTEMIQNDFSGMLTRNPAELDAAPRGTRGYGIWASAAGG